MKLQSNQKTTKPQIMLKATSANNQPQVSFLDTLVYITCLLVFAGGFFELHIGRLSLISTCNWPNYKDMTAILKSYETKLHKNA